MTVTPAARQPPMTAKLYYGSIAHSRSLTELEVVEKALMLVDEHGVIGWVHRDVTSASLLQEVAAEHGLDITRDPVGVVELDEDEFLCPGLIDTHTHAPQYTNIGLGNGVHLLNWLDQLTFPEESKYADVAYAKEVYSEVIRRTLNAGTTTSCYYGTMHLESTKTLVGLCLEKGQRAFVGKCSMDRLCSDTYVETTPDAIQSAQDFIDHFPHLSQQKVSSSSKPNGCAHGHDCGSHGGGALAPLVQPILTPRMAICTTPELLSSISALSASYDPPLAIQTHLDENKDEISTTLSLFPKSQSYASVYEDYGILHDGTILAHCVHLTQEEREVIRRTGAGVSHCPTSNFNLDSGVAKIRELLDMGIKVGLGTDCSGGYSLSLQPVLRLAVHVSQQLGYATKGYKALSVEESFFLATMGGAALCRLQGSIGNFEPGKEFDALRIKPASPGMWVRKGEPVRSRFERWFWSADDRDISEVYVRGRKVGGAGIAVAK